MRKLGYLGLVTLNGLSMSCSRRSNDEAISQDIQKKTAADPQAQDVQVTVDTKDGRVTLTGKARTAQARQEAETIAIAKSGVTAVDNEITIDENLPQGPATVAARVSPSRRECTASSPPPPPVVVIVNGQSVQHRNRNS